MTRLEVLVHGLHMTLALVAMLSLTSCGGAATRPAPSDEPVELTRWEPDVVRAQGSRAFRILGRGFGRRGADVRVRLTAQAGTPFFGGTSAVLEATATVDAAQQIRGLLPDPRIPRHVEGLVAASIDIELPARRTGTHATLRARFEPEQLVLHAIQPPQLDAVGPGTGSLLGTGFDPVGGRALLRFTAWSGTPFLGKRSVEVVGTIASGGRIDFPVPAVGAFDYGPHHADVRVTLVDADGATLGNVGWTALFLGPVAPPPFAIARVEPADFVSRAPVQFTVEGRAFAPVGARVTARFTADVGTPFAGGTAAHVEVPMRIESSTLLRGLSPYVRDIASRVSTDLRISGVDGTSDALPRGACVFAPHDGVPRLVLNEIDYDQSGADDAEFIEIYNAGDADARLVDYSVELVNGAGGGAARYRTFDLPSATLAPGDFFVLSGSAANVPNTDLEVSPATSFIQNGAPDGLALLHHGVIVDALGYEGDIRAPYREGSGSGLTDPGAGGAEHAIARFLDGFDSDRNDFDFEVVSPPTPGAPNTGSHDRPYAANVDATGTHPGHLTRWSSATGRGVSLGPIVTRGGVYGLAFRRRGGLVATDVYAGASRLLHIRQDGSLIWDVGTVHASGANVQILDLAVHPTTDEVYALSDEDAGSGGLYRIDLATAQATRLGATPLTGTERNGGLAFASDGTLYMTTRGFAPRLLTLDPDDATQRSSVSLSVDGIIGLAARPSDAQLFGCAQDSGDIFEIATNGRATLLGKTLAGPPGALSFER